MQEFLAQNATAVSLTAAALVVVLAVVAVVLAYRARELRLDLKDADRELAELDSTIAEQAARLRITRDLHEVAVSSLSGMIARADAARYIAESDPSVATRTAAELATTARATLMDLRRTVTATGDIPPEPTRIGIATTDELVDRFRGAGLVIAVEESGEPFELQPAAELAIARIVEEALSNALTYGGEGTDVRVSITWTAEGLQLLVDDDGVQAAARREGREPGDIAQDRRYTAVDDLRALTGRVTGEGVTEMRERTAVFGGAFQAYPVPGVGFSVSAAFPTLRYDNGVHQVNLS